MSPLRRLKHSHRRLTRAAKRQRWSMLISSIVALALTIDPLAARRFLQWVYAIVTSKGG